MGKPAARVTDMTAHGGMITGPGCPTVLIGKMPAARIGDMHMCPMVTPGTPPIPHVGGPIIGPGCPTVLIGKMPAVAMGDMAVCVGPPSTILMGCPTVLVGPSGAGGGGGSGASTADAKVAKTRSTKAPKKIKGLNTEGIEITEVVIGEDPELSENAHRLDLKIVGDEYENEEGVGNIKDAIWSKERCWFGDKVKLTIKTSNLEDGTKLKVQLFEWDSNDPDDFIEEIEVDSTGDETVLTWKAEFDTDAIYEEDEGDEFEIYPLVKIAKKKIAKTFRLNLLYVDVVDLGAGI